MSEFLIGSALATMFPQSGAAGAGDPGSKIPRDRLNGALRATASANSLSGQRRRREVPAYGQGSNFVGRRVEIVGGPPESASRSERAAPVTERHRPGRALDPAQA
jgi:hypothetical protein